MGYEHFVKAFEPSNIVSGRQLRAARILAGLTQKQFAQAVGVHERAVRYWELKDDKPPTSTTNFLDKMDAVLRDNGVIVFATPSARARTADDIAGERQFQTRPPRAGEPIRERRAMKRSNRTTKPKFHSRSVSTLTEEERADLKAFAMRGVLEAAADYAARGRKFAALSDSELDKRYVEAFQKVVDNPVNWDNRAIKCDLDAEFQLRQREPPLERIREEIERLGELGIRELKRIEAEDPERWAEINRDIAEEFEQFLADRKNAS
jgi:transcriptional regulator with XRE-family HTH domain